MIFKDFYQLKQERNERVQIFSIRLRDMLTKLSIRFLDRVPKEDHDKILKDRFFYRIKSELQNIIRHPYDNESITFSQLLVKAHRNEEEETTSKIVSKNVTIGHDSTLEQRVDNLIAKSSSNPAPLNLTNRNNNRPYGHPPFWSNSRPRGDYRQDHRHPPMGIWKNLRGPETSAAGPFRKADSSRPIQCFQCRGWGHPKRLCPSHLNYTWGSGTGQSLPDDRQETGQSPSPKPISSTIDMKISQVAEKYHNPDPLVRLIGPANEAVIIVEGQEFPVHDPGSRNCAIIVLYTVSIVPSSTSRV